MNRRALLSSLLVLSFACAAPQPPAPAPVPAEAPAPIADTVVGKVRVTASALNIRKSASPEGEVARQVKKGERLDLIALDESWAKVRLADGSIGFVAARYVEREGATAVTKSKKGRKSSCPADSDFAFSSMPTPAFSDSGAHGTVVVDAYVDTSGNVTQTKLISNSTGDEALAFLTQREIKGAKFIAPVRNCAARSFIYTYSRTF